MRNQVAASALVIGLLNSGCNDHQGSADDHVVTRDSADIRIVESAASAGREAPWTVSPEPPVAIGLEDGEAPYLFGAIAGTLRVPDGSIAVADGQAGEIRFFDADGRFIRASGKRGDGPGEFSDLAGLWNCGENRIYAYDRRRRRILEWTPNGQFVRDFGIVEPNSERGPFKTTCSPRGELLVAGWGDTRALVGLTRSQFVPHIAPIWLLDSIAQPIITLGEFQIGDRVFIYNPDTGGGSAGLFPFGRAAELAADSEYVFLATDRNLEVFQFSRDGSLVSILRGPTADLTLSDTVIESYLHGRANRRDSAFLARIRNEQLAMPGYYPAIAAVRMAPTGHIWVKRFQFPWEQESRWGVFAPEGSFLGHVTMPPRLDVHDIGVDYILGVARDELDVERVQLHSIRRSVE